MLGWKRVGHVLTCSSNDDDVSIDLRAYLPSELVKIQLGSTSLSIIQCGRMGGFQF